MGVGFGGWNGGEFSLWIFWVFVNFVIKWMFVYLKNILIIFKCIKCFWYVRYGDIEKKDIVVVYYYKIYFFVVLLR